MARASLVALLILLGITSVVPGDSDCRPPAQDLSIAADLLAPFSAASAKVEGDTLVLSDLRGVEKSTKGRQLAGRVLLNGDKHAFLGLRTLKVARDMARATPLLGREAPGQTILNPARRGAGNPVPAVVPFRTQVRLTLIPLDARGAPRTPRRVKVSEIRLAGVRCR